MTTYMYQRINAAFVAELSLHYATCIILLLQTLYSV